MRSLLASFALLLAMAGLFLAVLQVRPVGAPDPAPARPAAASLANGQTASGPDPANPASVRAAALLTSHLPAYLPRLEFAPQPSAAFKSQLGGVSRAVALRGHLVLVGLGARVLAFDVSDPDAPVEIGRSAMLPGVVEDIRLTGNRAWIAAGLGGILALDLAAPDALPVMGAYDTPGRALSLDVSTEVGLLADGDHLLTLDLRDPRAVRELGRWPAPTRAMHVTRAGDRAFVTDERAGLHALDVADPAAMRSSAVFDRDGDARASLMHGETLYFNSGRDIHVLDLRDPGRLVEAGHLSLGRDRGRVRAGMAVGKHGLVADGRLYELSNPWFPRRISGPLADTKGTDLVRGDALATDSDLVVVARGDEHGGFILGDLRDPRAPRRRGGPRLPGELGGDSLRSLPDEAALDLGGRRIDVRDVARPRHAGETSLPRSTMALHQGWALAFDGFDEAWIPRLALHRLRPPTRRIAVPAHPGGDRAPRWIAETGAWLGDTVWIAGSTRTNAWDCPVLVALDVADIGRPRWAGMLAGEEDLPANITRIATDAASARVVVGHGWERGCGDRWWDEDPGTLTIVDATEPARPVVVDHLEVPGTVHDIVTWQGTAFVATDRGGLRVVDLDGPGAPREIGVLDDGDERARALALDWPYLWLGYSTDLRLVDVREPARPREVLRRELPSEVVAMTLHHGLLWVATHSAGLMGFDAGR